MREDPKTPILHQSHGVEGEESYEMERRWLPLRGSVAFPVAGQFIISGDGENKHCSGS